jgi:hypothetical protein
MRRTRTGKRLALTERDLAIFRTLARYRYLRSTYLHAFVGGASETRFKERLGDLFHEGFIDRPEKQWEFANARYQPAVYEIGNGAKRVLDEHGGRGSDPRTFLAATAHRQFAHSVLICEALASIELATVANPDLRFIPWPEILSRAPDGTKSLAVPFRIPTSIDALIPDGFFGLEYRGEGGRKAYRFFALEIDRGTMPIARSDGRQTSYLGKLAAYREIIERRVYRSHLAVPNLFVLTITSGTRRLAEIVRRFGEHEPNPLFLFKSVEEHTLMMPAPSLLADPWQRAGSPPLAIAESC